MMSVFPQFTADQLGIAISPGESFNIPNKPLSPKGQAPLGLTDLTAKAYKANLPPAVVTVPPEHIRGYVHNKKVNHYLVGSNLGEGSFAKVKEAFHTLVGEKVAMKVIDKKKAMQDPYVAKNFKREAKLLQMVRHPNILQLLEVIETDSSFYLITELCSGGELMKYIYKKGQLEEAETRKFMRQIVSAVDHLHKAGIIHRDLKVENMLLDANMDIKIIDFGLSNEEYVQGENGLTHCSTQCGSPAYAAPELLGHKTYGPQVDIWSIGVNMYAMLTGCLPYTVEPFNITALHAKMLENKMNPIPDHLSETCKDLLKQLLKSNPTDRIQMPGIMSHPWMNEGHTLPFGPAPFPNKLQGTDVDADIMQHMVYVLKLKDTEDEVRQELISNRSTSTAAIYHLLIARLARYRKHFPSHSTRVRHKSKVSRDQGYYEGEEDDDLHSIRSMPTGIRPSRKSSRHNKPDAVPLRQKRPGAGRTRPITHPPGMMDEEESPLAQTMPASYNFGRRQTMPEMMLKQDIEKLREAAQKREVKQEESSFTSTSSSSPTKQTTRPFTRAQEHRQQHSKRHTHPSGPHESLNTSTGASTLVPLRQPQPLRRNHYSTPSALNQIRENLASTLPPNSTTGGVINAWHSNPTSRNHSRNPSRQGSRHPSGRMPRATSNNAIHTRAGSTDAADPSSFSFTNEKDDLTFHEVWSNTIPRTRSKNKVFTIGGSPEPDSLTELSHLPAIMERTQPAHNGAGRKKWKSDGAEKRNGFVSSTSHIRTLDVRTELGANEMLTEIIRAAHSLKLKEVEPMASGVICTCSNLTKFSVSFVREHPTLCTLNFHWISGDLQTYKEKSEKLSRKIKL